MELKGLKERKRILNDRLMRFEGGLDIPGGRMEGVGFPSSEQPSFDINQSPSGTALQNGTAINRPTLNYAEPAYKASSAAGAGPWFALGEWLGTGLLEGLDRVGINSLFVNNTRDRWLQDAGTTQGSIGGINYELQNLVSNDTVQNEKDAYAQEAAKKWAINPVAATTMLIGWLAHMRKLERAQELANREAQLKNSYNSNMALSKFMNMQAIGNLNSQMLYAKDGKDGYKRYTGENAPYMKNPMNMITPWGQAFGIPNSILAKGEVIADNLDGDNKDVVASRLGNQKSNKDTIPAFVTNSTFVGTNLNGISDLAAPFANNIQTVNKRQNNKKLTLFRGKLGKDTDDIIKDYSGGMIKNVRDLQVLERNAKLLPQNKQGGMLHAASGWESIVPIINSLSNMGVAIGQYIRHKHDPIKQSDSYRDNPYAGYALQGLNNLRYSYDPIARRVLDYDAQGRYQIANSGGLSQSLKGLANVAQTLGTQRNLIDLMSNIDDKNVSLRGNYYNTILQHGENERQARNAAYLRDLDYYSRAEAAKRMMMSQHLNDVFVQKDQGLADYLKYRQFLDTYHLYDTGKMK